MALTDYFATDGKTRPWYGTIAYPAAFHAAATGITWLFWESYSSARIIRVTTVNPGTGVWTADVTIDDHPLENDDHGVPQACRDADGYVHVFGGSHETNAFEWVTNAADNPAAWTLRTTFSNDLSYPRPVLVGSTIWLIVRDRDPVATKRNLALYKTTGITAGVPTWGAVQQLIDFGVNSRVYTSNPILDGTDIHLSVTFSDYLDGARKHQYYFILDTTDGSIRNADSSVTVASGSLPISLATANASFRVVTSGSTTTTDVAAHCLDASGDPHIVYLERTAGVTILRHMTFTGGSWSSPTTIETLANDVVRFSSTLLPYADGSLELWHDEDDAKLWTSGGNMVRLPRSSGGVWGSRETIREATSYALGNATVVRDGHANARIGYAELTVGSSDASGGNLKMFLHGDGGPLQREIAAGPPPIEPGEGDDPHFANVILLLQGRP